MRRFQCIPALPALLLTLAVGAGALWWWAVLRLLLVPAEAGPVEGAVAVGGWGLGLLPVHCVRGPAKRPGRAGAGAGDGGGGAVGGDGGGAVGGGGPATRASLLRRSGGGSGPS